jgi:hypothetical protein
MPTEPERTRQSLVSLIDTYCRRVCGPIVDQHPGSFVASPLGTWLLLATCASAAAGQDKQALEDALGCPCEEAAEHLRRFLDEPPPALHSAFALWVRKEDHTTPLVECSASLPRQVERGPVPTKQAADAWAERQTDGLIRAFPDDLPSTTRLVLASVLATRVSWETPFAAVRASDHLTPSSPWRDDVSQVLLDESPSSLTTLATTEAAGVVAVHFAQGAEDIGVLSVAADPTVARAQVVEAALELARLCRDDALASARTSLFDLPLGRGHSWELTEHEVLTSEPGRSEMIEGAVLVAWEAESRTDLSDSPAFGIESAAATLFGLIGSHPVGDELRAVQSARARYTPTGFEAAAISSMAITLGASGHFETEKGIERRAKLVLDHPYAAVALAGRSSDFRRARAGHSETFCLPLFVAWVTEPSEAAGEVSEMDALTRLLTDDLRRDGSNLRRS